MSENSGLSLSNLDLYVKDYCYLMKLVHSFLFHKKMQEKKKVTRKNTGWGPGAVAREIGS